MTAEEKVAALRDVMRSYDGTQVAEVTASVMALVLDLVPDMGTVDAVRLCERIDQAIGMAPDMDMPDRDYVAWHVETYGWHPKHTGRLS